MNNSQIRLLQLAKEAATDAGDLLISEFSNDSIVRSEKGKDIKTEADLAAEAVIVSKLSTNIPIVSEEQYSSCDLNLFNLSHYQWIIDPLDGTLNFTRGFPLLAYQSPCGVMQYRF